MGTMMIQSHDGNALGHGLKKLGPTGVAETCEKEDIVLGVGPHSLVPRHAAAPNHTIAEIELSDPALQVACLQAVAKDRATKLDSLVDLGQRLQRQQDPFARQQSSDPQNAQWARRLVRVLGFGEERPW